MSERPIDQRLVESMADAKAVIRAMAGLHYSIVRERSERLESWCCLRASVNPDGSVGRISTGPLPWWTNRGA